MTKSFSDEIVEYVKRFFTEDDWKYEYREDLGLFHGGIAIKGKMNSVKFILDVKDDFVINYTKYPLNVDEARRDAVARFVTRANYGMMRGGFETDLDDGEVRYRLTASLADLRADYEGAMRLLMHLPAQMCQKYGDELLAVMFGFKTPDEAVQEAEKD